MATKHTPGPWAVECDPIRVGKRYPSGLPRMALVITGDGKLAIDCTGSGDGYKTDCANATLIAAAPELLEAAREAIGALLDIADADHVSRKAIHEALSNRGTTAVAMLRAAIAKAEGDE